MQQSFTWLQPHGRYWLDYPLRTRPCRRARVALQALCMWAQRLLEYVGLVQIRTRRQRKRQRRLRHCHCFRRRVCRSCKFPQSCLLVRRRWGKAAKTAWPGYAEWLWRLQPALLRRMTLACCSAATALCNFLHVQPRPRCTFALRGCSWTLADCLSATRRGCVWKQRVNPLWNFIWISVIISV